MSFLILLSNILFSCTKSPFTSYGSPYIISKVFLNILYSPHIAIGTIFACDFKANDTAPNLNGSKSTSSFVPIVLGYYFKSKAQNTVGGITYDMAMAQMQQQNEVIEPTDVGSVDVQG